MVFHVLNRGVTRMHLFEKAGDYQAFERVVHDRRTIFSILPIPDLTPSLPLHSPGEITFPSSAAGSGR